MELLLHSSAPPKLVNLNNPTSPCGTLPVTITNFSARWNNNTVDLQWKITNEINLKSFDLEYSIDGTYIFQDSHHLITTRAYAEYGYTHLTPCGKKLLQA